MGPLLVLVSPNCFRKNVKVICKIVSFWCSLDNFLLKNAIVFFFGNQISKWRSFEKKKTIFDLLSKWKRHKNPSAHIPLLIHTPIWLTLLTFCAYLILQKMRIYHIWFLFRMTPGIDSFCAIVEQSTNNRMVSKILIGINVYLWYLGKSIL